MLRTGVTGNSSCSVHGAVGNGVYSKAMGDSPFSDVGASSCNVYSAANNGICSNATGYGSELSHVGDGICSITTVGSSMRSGKKCLLCDV